MIKRAKEIVNGAKRKGTDLYFETHEYEELVKLLNPVAKEFVNSLFEMGYIKSDPLQISSDNFYGIRANLDLRYKSYYDLLQIIQSLDITPSLIFVREFELEIFYKPNRTINLVSNEDYLELIYSFIEYVKQYEYMGIKFSGWNLDSKEMVECNHNKGRDTLFSKSLFNSKGISWE